LYVEVKGNNVDRAIRVLKKKLVEDGIFNILRQKQYYEKPTDKRRREKRAAIVRHRRAERERQE
jgi:small subunit ribosomal protein S21